MTRPDLYRNVHKGQRLHLFALAGEIGRADPQDAAQVAELAGRVRAALGGLRDHAEHEEHFIHPVLRQRASAVAEALEREHRWVDSGFMEVEESLRRLGTMPDRAAACAGLYRAWCRMVAAYLAHLDNEERLAMPALWDSCSDEEIGGIMRAFVAQRSAGDLLEDLRAQMPALAPQERAAYVGGVMKSGKLSAERIWTSLAEVLAADDLARLRAAIAA